MTRRELLGLAPALALAGCASPNPALYTVAVENGAVRAGAPRVVEIQRVGLARYLERSEIVRSSENYRLAVLQNDWWGEPLAALLTRVLAEELGQRLPSSIVLTDTSPVEAPPGATVAVAVQRMDEDGAGRLIFQGQASVRFGQRALPYLIDFRYAEPVAQASATQAARTQAEVAAISVALGRLADRLAAALTVRPKRR